jgi:hypothetical protein
MGRGFAAARRRAGNRIAIAGKLRRGVLTARGGRSARRTRSRQSRVRRYFGARGKVTGWRRREVAL